MDLRKAFDTIDHVALFAPLEQRGVDHAYISLSQLLYQDQHGRVNDSQQFPIERGVKQGDVLSAILFNCVIDVVFESWKHRLNYHGLYVAHGLPRLTNTRYTDDRLLYVKSLDELIHMSDLLIQELT